MDFFRVDESPFDQPNNDSFFNFSNIASAENPFNFDADPPAKFDFGQDNDTPRLEDQSEVDLSPLEALSVSTVANEFPVDEDTGRVPPEERHVESTSSAAAPEDQKVNEPSVTPAAEKSASHEEKIVPQQEPSKRRRLDLTEDMRQIHQQASEMRIQNIIKREGAQSHGSNVKTMKDVIAEIESTKLELDDVIDSIRLEEQGFASKASAYRALLDQSSEFDIIQEKGKVDSLSQFADLVETEKENFTRKFLQTREEMDERVKSFYAGISAPLEELTMTRSKILARRQELQLDAKTHSCSLANLRQKNDQCHQLKEQFYELRRKEKKLLTRIIGQDRHLSNEIEREISEEKQQLDQLKTDKLDLQSEVDSLTRSKERDSDEIMTHQQTREIQAAENDLKKSQKAMGHEDTQKLYREFGPNDMLKSKTVLSGKDLEEMRRDLQFELKNENMQFEQLKWKFEQREEQLERLKERLQDLSEQIESVDTELEELNATKLSDLSQASTDSIEIL